VAAPGHYKAHLSTEQIDAQGVQSQDIGGGGLWTLAITPKTITCDSQTQTAPRTAEKTPAKAPTRPSFLIILLRALSALAV